MNSNNHYQSEDSFLDHFFQTLYSASNLLDSFNKLTASPKKPSRNNWADITQTQEGLQEALQELGWQTIKLYKAGFLDEEEESDAGKTEEANTAGNTEENTVDSNQNVDTSDLDRNTEIEETLHECLLENDDNIFPNVCLGFDDEEELDLDLMNEVTEIGEIVQAISTENNDSILVDFMDSEEELAPPIKKEPGIPATDEDINNFMENFSTPKSEPLVSTPSVVPEITHIDAWKTSNLCLTNNSNLEERTASFNQINRIFSKDFFSLWKEDAPGEFSDILRFFIATILYIEHFPRKERPNNAIGDGSYQSHLNSISEINATARKFVKDFSRLKTDPEELLEKIGKFWKRVEKNISKKKVSKKGKTFNIEKAFLDLQPLIEANNIPDMLALTKKMLQQGMSNDPRLIMLLSDKIDLLEESTFKKLRYNIRKYNKELNPVEEESSSEEIVAEWEFSGRFDDKNILIIGGDKRNIILKHCDKLLPNGDTTLLQIPKDKGYRRLESVVKSIQQGKFDYVLVIQDFVSHTISSRIRDAVKGNKFDTKGTLISNGYGEKSIQEGLLRLIEQEK